MRDKRFVAIQRGGVLSKEAHLGLAAWAQSCAEHVARLYEGELAPTLLDALRVSRDWARGETSAGAPIKVSRAVHRVAKKLTSPVSVSVARSIGQAAATAHMADHSLGAAVYALQAVARAGGSVEEERAWQLTRLGQLQPALVDFVQFMLRQKEQGVKIHT